MVCSDTYLYVVSMSVAFIKLVLISTQLNLLFVDFKLRYIKNNLIKEACYTINYYLYNDRDLALPPVS